VLDRLFKRSSAPAQHPPVVLTIPVLCRFWSEDGVWNGSAVDLPVSVYGNDIMQAQRHMVDAIICHLEALQEVGKLDAEVERLQARAAWGSFGVDQMSECELFWKTTATVSNHKVAAAMCP
jgi:hypothetical protein